MGWVLRAGGLAALVAAYMASKIDEERDVKQALQEELVIERPGSRSSVTLLRRTSSSGGLLDYHRAD